MTGMDTSNCLYNAAVGEYLRGARVAELLSRDALTEIVVLGQRGDMPLFSRNELDVIENGQVIPLDGHRIVMEMALHLPAGRIYAAYQNDFDVYGILSKREQRAQEWIEVCRDAGGKVPHAAQYGVDGQMELMHHTHVLFKSIVWDLENKRKSSQRQKHFTGQALEALCSVLPWKDDSRAEECLYGYAKNYAGLVSRITEGRCTREDISVAEQCSLFLTRLRGLLEQEVERIRILM